MLDAYEKECADSLSADTKLCLSNQYILMVINSVIDVNMFECLFNIGGCIKIQDTVCTDGCPELYEQVELLNKYIGTGVHNNDVLIDIANRYRGTYLYDVVSAKFS